MVRKVGVFLGALVLFACSGGEEMTTGDTESSGTSGDSGGAVCGDGEESPGEECDDGNTMDGDGCSSLCVAEAPRWMVLFRNTSIGNDTFYVFDLVEREYTELKISQASFLGVTASDTHAYIMSPDFLYRCEFATLQCEVHAPAPVWEVREDGFIEWVGDQICGAYAQTKTLACYQDGKWTNYPLPSTVGNGASWDPVKNELYIQIWTTRDSMVVDLNTHEVVRTLDVPDLEGFTTVHEYWDGYVYTASSGNVVNSTLYRIDAQTGETENTGVLIESGYPTAAMRDVEDHLYLGGNLMTGFRIDQYDPATGMMLPDPILGAPNKQLRLAFQRRIGLGL